MLGTWYQNLNFIRKWTWHLCAVNHRCHQSAAHRNIAVQSLSHGSSSDSTTCNRSYYNWQQICRKTCWLHIHDKLWIDVREPGKDVRLEIHQEQLVSWRRPKSFTGKLMVKVADISRTFLSTQTQSHSIQSLTNVTISTTQNST